jgi:hypothetical protein
MAFRVIFLVLERRPMVDTNLERCERGLKSRLLEALWQEHGLTRRLPHHTGD